MNVRFFSPYSRAYNLSKINCSPIADFWLEYNRGRRKVVELNFLFGFLNNNEIIVRVKRILTMYLVENFICKFELNIFDSVYILVHGSLIFVKMNSVSEYEVYLGVDVFLKVLDKWYNYLNGNRKVEVLFEI